MARDTASRLVYSTGGEVEPKAAGSTRRPLPAKAATKGGIRLGLERRASDRVVTVVTGLPGGAAETAALAKELKAACGAGGTVKGHGLELQGDHRARVEAALLARGLRSKRAGG